MTKKRAVRGITNSRTCKKWKNRQQTQIATTTAVQNLNSNEFSLNQPAVTPRCCCLCCCCNSSRVDENCSKFAVCCCMFVSATVLLLLPLIGVGNCPHHWHNFDHFVANEMMTIPHWVEESSGWWIPIMKAQTQHRFANAELILSVWPINSSFLSLNGNCDWHKNRKLLMFREWHLCGWWRSERLKAAVFYWIYFSTKAELSVPNRRCIEPLSLIIFYWIKIRWQHVK